MGVMAPSLLTRLMEPHFEGYPLDLSPGFVVKDRTISRMSTAKLAIALKEWAIVTDFLTDGKCCLLLRKGGIHEDGGPGRFRLDYDRFLLFPAWEHERLDWIKPAWLPDAEKLKLADGHLAVPETLTFRGYGEVAKVWKIPSREAFETLDDLHPWGKGQVDMRFNYKPEQPVYLFAVRAYKLAQPLTVNNDPAFAGCRSWVPMPETIVAGASPAMDDAMFEGIIKRVDAVMEREGRL